LGLNFFHKGNDDVKFIAVDHFSNIDNEASRADGRQYLDSTSTIMLEPDRLVKLTSRSYNQDIKLPPSGNYTHVYIPGRDY
jgi:hypothetical protein